MLIHCAIISPELFNSCGSFTAPKNARHISPQPYSPLLVLEQVCLRTGAGWSAFRSVSRLTGVSLTGVAGSEALLAGSLAGSGGDSMLDVVVRCLAAACTSNYSLSFFPLSALPSLSDVIWSRSNKMRYASVCGGGCAGLIVHWQR